jgi:hypothetical protein
MSRVGMGFTSKAKQLILPPFKLGATMAYSNDLRI